MPPTVEFTVRSGMLADALRVARDALSGRGFTIVDEHDHQFVATRGSHRLTSAFGAFVPRARQFVRLRVHGRHRPLGHSSVIVRPAESGTATSGGAMGAGRRTEVHAWAADGIERALDATGALIHRFDVD